MRVRVSIEGREREVRVRGLPPDQVAEVDGTAHRVRLAFLGDVVDAEVDGRRLELDFRGGLAVDGEGRDVLVSWAAEGAAAGGSSGSVDVRPPMPGRVVRIRAATGENVRRGAPLLVLEAMKMQNEIAAPIDGVVSEVLVREGDAVTARDVLLRLAPSGGGDGAAAT